MSNYSNPATDFGINHRVVEAKEMGSSMGLRFWRSSGGCGPACILDTRPAVRDVRSPSACN